MLPATFKFCKLSQLRKGSGCAKWKAHVWKILTDGGSSEGAMKSHLNWKFCWQTSWAHKDAGETTEQLKWWHYSQPGPVSPGSYIPQCSRGHVSLRGVRLIIPDKTTACLWTLTEASQFQEQYRLQVKFPSSWLEQRGGYLVTVGVWKGQWNKARAKWSSFSEFLKQIWAH